MKARQREPTGEIEMHLQLMLGIPRGDKSPRLLNPCLSLESRY